MDPYKPTTWVYRWRFQYDISNASKLQGNITFYDMKLSREERFKNFKS